MIVDRFSHWFDQLVQDWRPAGGEPDISESKVFRFRCAYGDKPPVRDIIQAFCKSDASLETEAIIIGMDDDFTYGKSSEAIPSHIPQSFRKNSISVRRMMVPTFFIFARQHGQVVGSPPQIRLMRDFQPGFSVCFFLGFGSGRMNNVLSADSESCLRAQTLIVVQTIVFDRKGKMLMNGNRETEYEITRGQNGEHRIIFNSFDMEVKLKDGEADVMLSTTGEVNFNRTK